MVWVTWSSEEKKKTEMEKRSVRFIRNDSFYFRRRIKYSILLYITSNSSPQHRQTFYQQKGKKTTFLIYVCPWHAAKQPFSNTPEFYFFFFSENSNKADIIDFSAVQRTETIISALGKEINRINNSSWWDTIVPIRILDQ